MKLILKALVDEDYSNYKECAMFLGFPHCTFKCEKECKQRGMCQNSSLATAESVEIDSYALIQRYLTNPLSHAIVIGGLEPFDDYGMLYEFIAEVRRYTSDSIIIYTGYNKDEISKEIFDIALYDNIIVKFGRFIPHQPKHLDSVLGVQLASPNQYAERIS